VTRIEFEVGDAQAGIADDLVVHCDAERPSRYSQIKFAVDDTTPLTYEWFTTPPRENARTPLERFFAAFNELSEGDHPQAELELITNRQVARGDPLLLHRSGINGTLIRAFASDRSTTKEALALWGRHLGIGDEELTEFLVHFRVRPNLGSLEDLRDRCGERMKSVGLRGDEGSVVLGVSIIRSLIEAGTRELDSEVLHRLIREWGIEAGPTIATLLIQEIDHRPFADLATAYVDWVDEFPGETPDERRGLPDFASWERDLRPDLRRAVQEVRDGGHDRVRIEGAYRLPTAFAVGFELNERSGIHVIVPTRDGDWESDQELVDALISTRELEISDEKVLAVAVSISAKIADDIVAHIQEGGPPTGKLLVIEPTDGPSRHAIAGPGEARAMADAIVDAVRAAAREVDAESVDLYLSCPAGLAVFLGRVWNRLPPGWILGDLNPGYGMAYRIETSSGSSGGSLAS